VAQAWSDGSILDVAANTLQVLGVVLPVLASALILFRIGNRTFRGLADWSHGSAGKRAVAAAISTTLVTALSWAWWPHPGNYQPIQPGEDSILTTVMHQPQTEQAEPADALARVAAQIPDLPGAALPTGTAADDRLSSGEPLVATFRKGDALPTKDSPALAAVLVPTDDNNPDGSGAAPEDTWVFPFDKPLPPSDGDNQALAVATKDGSVTYDLAFALVWAEGDEVLNVNEAHAYASCSDCVAVAVAFQVVLIMDDAQVVVPQNLAVSANYDCYRCITASLASQLVLSVQEAPGEEDLRSLSEVWSRLIEFAQGITSHSLTEIIAQLDAAKAAIVAILGEAPTVQASTSTGSPSEVSDGTGTGTSDNGGDAGDGGDTSSPASTEPTPEQEDSQPEPTTEQSTPTAPSSTPTDAAEPTPTSTPTAEDSPAPTADSSP
jgi:putative peptide zinc metalloprotease protein